MLFRPNLDWLRQDLTTNQPIVNGDYPKVTIITPSFNQGQYIEETIRSVLAQNYPNLEYFIFDGGSTDNTVDIIKKYDQYITYWETKPDNGQSHAINKGFGMATGDIIGWLNSDDLFHPETLQSVADHFKDKNYRKILYGEGTYLFDKYQISIKNTTARLSANHAISLCSFIIQPSSFWGKTVVDEIGGLDENLHYGFDWDWFIKASNKNIPFQKVIEDFSIYRIHEQHKSSTAGYKRIKEIANIYETYHGPTVSEAYLKFNKCSKATWMKRIFKHLPIRTASLRKLYWERQFKTIPFEVFESISIM